MEQMQPQGPMMQQPMASVWRIASDDAIDRQSDDKEPTAGSGDVHDKGHGEHEHPGHDWVDAAGQPLQEGAKYELQSPQYAIPDKVTVDRVLPDKLVFTVHTDMMDYQDEMTKEDLHNEGYIFSPVQHTPDSTDGFNAAQDLPVRPGQDAQPQQDDLSDQSTVVSHEVGPHGGTLYPGACEFCGDASQGVYKTVQGAQCPGCAHGEVNTSEHPERSWLMDENGPVANHFSAGPAEFGMGGFEVAKQSRRLPDARYAGKDYSPREQREFIDEAGHARNMGDLDLSGTHY